MKIKYRLKRVYHGLSKHPLYGIYNDILKRCYNKNCYAYRWYGARGVVMCEEWKKNFKIFYDWCIDNGWKRGMEVDKDIIPKKLGVPALVYSPEMCSVISNRDNMNAMGNNINLEYLGKKQTLSQWANEYGINYKLFWRRLNLGWSMERALSTHKTTTQETGKSRRKILLNTKTGTFYSGFKEAAESIGMKENTLFGKVYERRGCRNNTPFVIA